MNKIINVAKKIWNDESAQGSAEYILLLVAVVAVAIIFKQKIKDIVTAKMDEIGKDVSGFSSTGG